MADLESRQVKILSQWGKGYISKGVARLNYPEDALRDGYDVILADGGLHTRPGYSSLAGNLLAGDVQWLGQVRFPTNDLAYLLAQVKDPDPDYTDLTTVPGAVTPIRTIWDIDNERVIIWQGEGTQDQNWYAYDPTTHDATLITPSTDPFEGIPYDRFHDMIYLPSEGEALCVLFTATNVHGNSIDLSTGEWTGFWNGASPISMNSGNDRVCSVLRNSDLIIARNGELLQMDLATKTLASFSNQTGITAYSGTHTEMRICYDGDEDVLYAVLSEYTTSWITHILAYDFGTDTWSAVANVLGYQVHDLYVHFLFCTGLLLLHTQSDGDLLNIIDVATGDVTTEAVPTSVMPTTSYYIGSLLTDDAGEFYCYSYSSANSHIFHNPVDCSFQNLGHSYLYATPTHLPATTLVWTQIYDLGTDAGRISVAVLGDRCIITDANFANPPLVWMGCLSSDGSDWAYPNHVLIFKNGQQAYDVSQYVLDKDSTVSADIGDIDVEGFIDIVTDVPKIEAFYLEMGSVNVGLGAAQAYSVTQDFASSSDIARQDLKGDIVTWVRNDADTNIDAGDAVEKVDGDGVVTGLVGIPCTGHPFSDYDVVVIAGSTAYNGTWVLDADTSTNELVIETTYVAETFTGGGAETVRLNKSTGHFEGTTYTLDNASATDEGGGLVGLPLTGQPYSTGDIIEVRDTINYDGSYSVDASSSANKIVITASYVAEGFAGTETVNQRITLGSGNDAPNVEAGLQIVIASTTKQISAITDDGEADNEVELSSATDDGAVTALYGIDVLSDAISTIYSYDEGVVELVRPSDGKQLLRGYSLRIIIDGSEFADDRENPSFTFRHYHCTRILHASIGERSGSTLNTVATPVEITFNNGESGYWDGKLWDPDTDTVPPAIDIVSDNLKDFTIETAKQYLVTVDLGWDYTYLPRELLGLSLVSYGVYIASCWVSASLTGSGYYYRWRRGGESEYYDDSTPIYSWTLAPSGCPFLYKITSQTLFPLYSSQRVVAHTTDASRQAIYWIDQLTSITLDQSTPGSSVLFHAASFDNRSTFQVFKAAAWRSIVQYSTPNWQYNDSATATPNWVNATTNTLLGALYEAFGVSYNQWTKIEIEAMDSDDWQASGGFVLGTTIYLNWAVSLTASGTDWPALTKITISYLDTGSAIIEGFKSGDWTEGSGWTDNTALTGIPLAQDGTIEYDGSSAFEADYHTLDGIPGFHYRLKMFGTSAAASITRLLYKAPCQALSNIGLGVPDYPLRFVWYESDTGILVDYTYLVIDETFTELASAPSRLDENKWIYIGNLTQFSAVELFFYSVNSAAATLTWEYWTGLEWKALTVTDGTHTFGGRGIAEWTVPTDWKTSVPLDASLYRGYYVRVTSSAQMTAATAISECRVYSVPPDLVKHRECVTFRDRVSLIGRPDFQDMVEISRQYEEYGFWGSDSKRDRVGGTDSIQCAIQAWSGLLLGKRESLHFLTGSSPSDFAWTTIEASRHVPINSRVIVKAPVSSDDGLRNALFYLNQYGAFAMSGLQADTTFATGRVSELSRNVDWWDSSSGEYIDIGTLADTGCGVYWPRLNWIVWSVPMVVSGTSQATNNRLLVFDLTLGAWLPPIEITASSLCTAFHYDAGAPGGLADLGLYGGDYSGNILQLFSGDATSDDGTVISMQARTGLITCGSPHIDKEMMHFRVFGSCEGSGNIKIYRNGESNVWKTITFADIVNPSGKDIAVDYSGFDMFFRYLEIEVNASGPTVIEAIEFEYVPAFTDEGQGV